MWECPDLFEMDGQLYIICCPQGVETQGIDYENVHQVTAMKLDYDFDTDEYEITDIKLFDRGFDFYAPQRFLDHAHGCSCQPDNRRLSLIIPFW